MTIETQIARFFPVPQEGEALPPFNSGAHAVRSITIDLTTARSGTPLRIGGNFLWLADANVSTAAVTVAFSRENSSEGIPFKQGTAIKGVRFSEVLITNTAQPGVTATFVYITESSQALEVVNAGLVIATVGITKASLLPTIADVALGAAATTLVLAANITRRQAIITNLAANGSIIRVGDSNTGAARGVEVQPGETITLDVTGAIYAYNPGAIQSVGVLEILD